MSSVSLSAICDSMIATLGPAASIKIARVPSEIKEGVADWPLLEIYPETGTPSSRTGTERVTSGGAVRMHEIEMIADVYVRQRGHLADYLVAMMRVTDELINILEAQRATLFGLSGLKAMQWRWERADIVRNEIHYPGVRFTITLFVF